MRGILYEDAKSDGVPKSSPDSSENNICQRAKVPSKVHLELFQFCCAQTHKLHLSLNMLIG